jgi:hypothetical protein
MSITLTSGEVKWRLNFKPSGAWILFLVGMLKAGFYMFFNYVMLLLFEKDGQRKYFSLLFRQTHKYQHPVENRMNEP